MSVDVCEFDPEDKSMVVEEINPEVFSDLSASTEGTYTSCTGSTRTSTSSFADDDIDKNAQDIEKNAHDIERNAHDIEKNAQEIERNAQDIEKNAEDIEKNAKSSPKAQR